MNFHDTPYYRAKFDRYVCVVRTEVPFPSAEVMHDEFARLAESLQPHYGRPMIYDTRRVQGRLDPEYEEATKRWYLKIVEEFTPVVILVSTVVGMMHANRVAKEQGKHDLLATTDSELAKQIALGERTLPET